jgi:predicted aspartyl protease
MTRSDWALLALAALAASPVSRADEAPNEPPPAALVGDLPFLDFKEPNRIVLNLAPDGSREFRLMLDTGAADSVLTPKYARDLGVSIRRARDRPYERDTRLGRPLQFWVDVQSSDTASRTGWEYGLLGGTFFADYVLDLDFPARRVRFIDPDKWQVPKSVSAPEEAVLPLRIVGNRVMVDVGIDGKTVDVMLDTGAPYSVMISGPSAKHAGFSPTRLARMGGGGVLGPVETYLVEAQQVSLGPFQFQQVPMLLCPNGFYNMGGSSDSLIGYELLSHFHVRIDYPHKRLWLRRANDEPVGWFGQSWSVARRVGLLAFTGNQGITIEGVLPDSPAAKLGIQPGDEIEFHGDTAPAKALEAALETIERGERITVTRAPSENEPPVQVELGGEKSPTPAK